MIEKWLKAVQSYITPLVEKMVARIKTIHPRIWIISLVVFLFGVRGVPAFYNQHFSDRNEIANAIGSIGFFYGTPQIDHFGSHILSLRTSEKGVGLFVNDLTCGKKILLKEWPAGEDELIGSIVFPFSPDDKWFAYTYNSVMSRYMGQSESFRYMAICEAGSGEEAARFEAPKWVVTESVWLTSTKLAWIRRKELLPGEPAVFQLHLTERKVDGKWQDWSPNFTLTNISCLTALSSNTVAWLDINGIYAMNTASNSVMTLFQAPEKRLSEFSYSQKTGQFLVTCREKGSFSLWQLTLNSDVPDFLRLTSDRNIKSARWIDDNRGYAYLDQNVLVIKANVAEDSLRLTKATANMMMSSENSRNLFFVGVANNEPGMGCWRYDLDDQTLTNVIPYSDSNSSFALSTEPVRCVFDNQTYYIYRPANFNRHKKYPLLIGDTFFTTHTYQGDIYGPSWAEAMAACGAYVVIVDRKTWFLEDYDEWGKDIMAVYHHLMPDPTIDANQVYLYAVSAETAYMNKLLEQKPDLWKGIILMNPTDLPDTTIFKSGKRLPKILISAGADEGESARFEKLQKDACGNGVLVQVVEHPDSGHILKSIAAVRGRICAMKDFVFNN